MDAETLKSVGLVAGIGGIALAVLMTVFREVIRKNIFAQLDPHAGYRLLRLILVLTWSVAIIGVGAWLMAKRGEQSSGMPLATTEFKIVGLITDQQENGIADANVSIVGNGSFVRSDSAGSFTLPVALGDERDVIVRITKNGFRPKTQPVTLPTKNLIVVLDAAQAVDPLLGAHDAPPSAPAPRSIEQSPTTSPALAINRGAISIQYLGDALGCMVTVQMHMGGRDFTPVTNPFLVTDIALGATSYTINGVVTCPMAAGPVSCAASGSGQLDLRSGGVYNVVWQNTALGQCTVGLTPAG